MNHLVVIVGGTGAGKSFILSRITEINKAFLNTIDENRSSCEDYPYSIIKKYTTRSPRLSETEGATDLYCNASVEDFEKCGKFIYTYGNHCYGIDCSEIDYKLSNGQSPVVIVRDFRIVELLKQRYNCVVDIYCKSGLSKDDLAKVLKKNGAQDDEILARMNNIVHDDNQWLYSDNKFYDYIVNRYDESFIPAIISSLRRAPKWNSRKIAIIAVGKKRIDNITLSVNAASDGETQFIIEPINALDFDNDCKTSIVNTIKNSWLTIIDISFNQNVQEDSHGLYRLVNIVFNVKHGDDKLVIADTEMSQLIPFDIINSRVYFYDNQKGTLPFIVRNQLQGIFGHN